MTQIKLKARGPDTELDKIKKEASTQYKEIKKLYVLVNTGNSIGRNRLCLCKSGKKWKKCCLKKHESQTLVLEKLCKRYGETLKKARKLMKEKIV